MDKVLSQKISGTVSLLKKTWEKVRGKNPFIAFSTGKDSLLVTSLLYEAVAPEKPVCLYSHHDLEFDSNLDYLRLLGDKFNVQKVHPFLSYFELMDRGISFLTLKDPWCVPMLVGTGILQWLQENGCSSPESCFMFRGMSATEYSHKWHATFEKYDRLRLPTMNPILNFTKDEVLQVLQCRYGLPLNPIYEHMDRTYCICCYTSDKKRQEFSQKHHPEICRRYYGKIEEMLFGSGLLERSNVDTKYKTKEEKLDRHGFVYWNRVREQSSPGAIKIRNASGVICYHIKDEKWIDTKHLAPVNGNWIRKKSQLLFWDIPEEKTDCLIKRMINCLNCGFCVVQCFRARQFNREKKCLELTNCQKCGKCINVKFCMGWKHRFWRRTIIEK